MSQRINLWWNKSRRAQNNEDYETWVEGGVVPTMNAFDNGDTRATTVIVVPVHDKATRYSGKRKLHNGEYSYDGAGNGFGIGKEGDPMNTLTGADRHAIIFYGNRVADIRLQDDKINTLQARMGTGGNNMPMVATTQVRRLTPLECERLQGFPDGWTEEQVDTHRYKQMGNAVAVPVVEWIIQGITDTI
jgi:site-specific DNA-cytosine methylase